MFHFVPVHQVAPLQALVKMVPHPEGIGQKQWPVLPVPDLKVMTGKSGHVSAEAVVGTSEIYIHVILNQLNRLSLIK